MADEEDFVNVWEMRNVKTTADGSFYEDWRRKASAKHSSPELFGADALRRLYPNHSLVMSADPRMNILGTPGVTAVPLDDMQPITNLFFIPLSHRISPIPGTLVDLIEFGAFSLSWGKYDFLLYIVSWQEMFRKTQLFILHEGPDDPVRRLLLAAGIWQDEVHDEVWVFNQGFWNKDSSLWHEIQKANWKDVILKDPFKKSLRQDVNGFFSSEAIYKELAIPWKRGLILYGPPGNGKTISVKAIMKQCDAEGYRPLYVKSFQSWKGEEGAMEDVFNKARQLAPCMIVLEDLDSLINDRNRSFFLNQFDGLVGNDGLLVIGTTNHFERLDPGLSSRPSRFDRKYLFDAPDREGRVLYARYWQNKLKGNTAISFPDTLVEEIADSTQRFSFAFLKEAFVSTLITLANFEEADKPSFATVLREQIETLREQLGADSKTGTHASSFTVRDKPSTETHDINPTFNDGKQYSNSPGQGSRDIRNLLDALSDAVDKSEMFPQTTRVYDTHRSATTSDGCDFRALFDQMAAIPQKQGNARGNARIYTTHVPVPVTMDRPRHNNFLHDEPTPRM